MVRGSRQRLVIFFRDCDGSAKGRASTHASVPDQPRVGMRGAGIDTRVPPRGVIRAQDPDRGTGERQVDQGLVPDRLTQFSDCTRFPRPAPGRSGPADRRGR